MKAVNVTEIESGECHRNYEMASAKEADVHYVEFNPVRAEMVASVLDYPWSSARAHAGRTRPPEWLDHRAWADRYPAPKWREVLGLDFRLSGDLDKLREATRTGRPVVFAVASLFEESWVYSLHPDFA